MNYHHICKNNVALHIVQTHAPCILLLEGLDDLLFGNLVNNDQQQASGGNASSSGENEPQDKVAKRLMQFCGELGQAAMKQTNMSYATARTTTSADVASSSSSSSTGSSTTTSHFSRPMVDHAVFVMASCESIQRLGPRSALNHNAHIHTHTDTYIHAYSHTPLSPSYIIPSHHTLSVHPFLTPF